MLRRARHLFTKVRTPGLLRNLVVMHLCLLDNDHVEGAYDAACHLASLWASVIACDREAPLLVQLAADLCGDDPSKTASPPSFA